jgi:lycopene beta-cyclase
MIRGIDLYTSVLQQVRSHANIDFYTSDIAAVESNDDNAGVRAGDKNFSADYVFNSVLLNDWQKDALQKKNIYLLLQHFKGWLIKTEENVFDERIATFMDFRVSQERGTTFIYIMPVSAREALIEYTLFTREALKEEEYDAELAKYLARSLGVNDYSVEHSEFGIIPMTNYPFSKGYGRVINIGTAGGQTKGSSGYSFQFIQKHSEKIIEALIHGEEPLLSKRFSRKRFNLYDSIFLNVLYNKKISGEEIFAMLFKKNTPQQVLKFLDNETTFLEELKIMNTVPLTKFLPASLSEIFAR